jgi:hypothetical protein
MLLVGFIIAVLLAALGWLTVYDLNSQVEHYRRLWTSSMDSNRRLMKRHMRGESSLPSPDDDEDLGDLEIPDEYPEIEGISDRYDEHL